MMEYKGYIGVVEFDDEAGIFHGEVVNTRDVITFQGMSVAEIKKAFRESVDDYLEFCKKRGEESDKPFSGKGAAHGAITSSRAGGQSAAQQEKPQQSDRGNARKNQDG